MPRPATNALRAFVVGRALTEPSPRPSLLSRAGSRSADATTRRDSASGLHAGGAKPAVATSRHAASAGRSMEEDGDVLGLLQDSRRICALLTRRSGGQARGCRARRADNEVIWAMEEITACLATQNFGALTIALVSQCDEFAELAITEQGRGAVAVIRIQFRARPLLVTCARRDDGGSIESFDDAATDYCFAGGRSVAEILSFASAHFAAGGHDANATRRRRRRRRRCVRVLQRRRGAGRGGCRSRRRNQRRQRRRRCRASPDAQPRNIGGG